MHITQGKITREKLRMIANIFRTHLGFSGHFTDVPKLLELTIAKFPHLHMEIAEDKDFESGRYAEFIPAQSLTNNRPLIRIKESVYNNACNQLSNSYGRDRMTIVHEIAHFILIDLFGVEFINNYGRGFLTAP